MRRRICTVVGTKSSGSKYNPDVAAMARFAGKAAGELGFAVLTGGKSGVMADALEGAREAGTLTIGVLPEVDQLVANDFCDVVIPSGIGLARNLITALAGDVLIAVPGGLGTLQEMSYALEYKRPVLSWDSWQLPDVANVPLRTDRGAVRAWLEAQARRLGL